MQYRTLVASVLLAGLSGCGSIGVKGPDPLSGGDLFDRALMAFVRGDLEQAGKDLAEQLQNAPNDIRARELLDVVEDESGRRFAAPVRPDGVSWDSEASAREVLSAVLGRSARVRKAVFEIVEMRARLREANWAFSPEFDLLTRLHPAGILAGLGGSILRGLFERDSNVARAEEAVLKAVAGYARAKEDCLERALVAHLDFLESQRTAEILDGAIKLAEEQVELCGRAVEAGAFLPAALLDASRALEAARREHSGALARRHSSMTTLNTLLGRGVDAPLKLKTASLPKAPGLEYVALAERAKSERTEAREARGAVARAKARGGRPLSEDVNLRAEVSYGKSLREEERQDFVEGLGAGLRLTVPVFIWPLSEARSDRDDALRRQLELELERAEGEAASNAVAAMAEVRRAEAGLEGARLQSARLSEQVRVTGFAERWAEGSRLHSLRARLLHGEALRAEIAAQFAVERAYAKLYRAMGAALERLDFTAEEPVEVKKARRGLWVDGRTLVENCEEAEFVIDFATARDIGALFVSFPSGEVPFEAVRAILKKCREKKLQTYLALEARPEGALDEKLLSLAVGSAGERFDGLVGRVETPGSARMLFDSMTRVRAALSKLESKGVLLAASLPEGVDATLFDSVSERVDRVVLTTSSAADFESRIGFLGISACEYQAYRDFILSGVVEKP